MFRLTGRVYNAMMKFADGTSSAPQLANMFFCDGKFYATDSYALVRWTPAEPTTIVSADGESYTKCYLELKNKVAASTVVHIDSTMFDFDNKSRMLNEPDKLFDSEFKRSAEAIAGVNPNYIAAVAALGKAVRTDKCGSDGVVDISWTNNIFHAHINAGRNGYFDVVVMPVMNVKR